MENNNLEINTQNDEIAEEAILKAKAKAEKREAIKHGLKRFGAQIGITVGAGVVSHFILKALLPDDDVVEEELDVIESTVVEPDEDEE